MGEGPGGWDQAGATRMLFLHVVQYSSFIVWEVQLVSMSSPGLLGKVRKGLL